MSEGSKIVDEGLQVLRGFPLPFRLAALVCLLVPAVIFLHAHYNWPHWPVHDLLWMNWLGLAFLIIALFILVSYTPRPGMSIAELPETKPVFAESLKYFKEGPEQKGPRGDLLKGLQNAYETPGVRNSYELPPEQMQICATSAWDFDRIAFYLFERYKAKPAVEVRITHVRHEMRLLATRRCLAPLHYAVESVYPGLCENGPGPQFSEKDLEPFREILKELNNWTTRLRRAFTAVRGQGIINNCRGLLAARNAAATAASKGAARG